MRRLAVILVCVFVAALADGFAQAPGGANGPYRVLKRVKVGGEGGWDYLSADAAARRLYIPRGATAQGAGARLTVFNLDTLAPVGSIDGVSGHGTTIDPQSGHGFVSGTPISMFDTKTMKVVKTIDPRPASPDGILFDAHDERVYVFSHPTKSATVIDAKDGSIAGTIDLGGTPEEGVADGKGTLYVMMQDMPGSVAVVDESAMKTTTHYPVGDAGRCNGLALDATNGILFAACGASGGSRSQPGSAKMVILRAADGRILTTFDMPGSSDGAVFNPSTREAFATLGNGKLFVVKETGPSDFAVEQVLDTMDGARTITLDAKSGHILTMADVRGPAPAAARGRGRGFRPTVPASFTILEIGR
jgi:DNA-binding beta-propeller fold protein YncE